MRLSLLILILSHSAAFGQLSKTEKKIAKAVEAYDQMARKMLLEVININSGTMSFDGVKQVADVFAEKFEALGLETQWVDGSAFNRSGHLLARSKGNGEGKKILLIGHLDTVFEKDSPFQAYEYVNDTTVKGPGIADMKGGDVIIWLALQALKEAGQLKNIDLEIVLTGDEEKPGSPLDLARQDLINAAKWADIALGFENGDGNPKTVLISRRGSTGWKLEVSGNAAHSSQVFTEKVGAGAIYEASRILTEFYQQLKEEEFLTFNPGAILGGTEVDFDSSKDGGMAFGKKNVVAQKVVVQGDLRAVNPEQLERVKAKMQEIVNNHLPKTDATLTFEKTAYPPMAPRDRNRELMEMYSQASQDLGYGEVEAVHPLNAGAADVCFTSEHVDMVIDGLGLSGADDHTINETGHINMLAFQAKRAALLIYRLGK